MHKYFRPSILCLTFCFSFSSLFAQVPSNSPDIKTDYSGEAFVTEQFVTRIAFENDGTYQREFNAQIRIQSDAGVQHYSVLTVPYQKSTETLGIDYVRVRKPDGTTVVTPQDNVQDMPAEVTRQAPVNLAELQVEDLEHSAKLAAFWGTLGWGAFPDGSSRTS